MLNPYDKILSADYVINTYSKRYFDGTIRPTNNFLYSFFLQYYLQLIITAPSKANTSPFAWANSPSLSAPKIEPTGSKTKNTPTASPVAALFCELTKALRLACFCSNRTLVSAQLCPL